LKAATAKTRLHPRLLWQKAREKERKKRKDNFLLI
jgi:hypothetical protein